MTHAFPHDPCATRISAWQACPLFAPLEWPKYKARRKGRCEPLGDDREETDMKLIDTLKTAAANHALYKRTRDEIARLPRDMALDIGIFPEDAHRIAWAAVYGK